jgi:hypothetical protein
MESSMSRFMPRLLAIVIDAVLIGTFLFATGVVRV